MRFFQMAKERFPASNHFHGAPGGDVHAAGYPEGVQEEADGGEKHNYNGEGQQQDLLADFQVANRKGHFEPFKNPPVTTYLICVYQSRYTIRPTLYNKKIRI